MFIKKKTKSKDIPKVSGLEIYKVISNLDDSHENDLSYYLPVIGQIKKMTEEAYNSVCCRGQSKRVDSPTFSDMQMGFFCNIFCCLAVCNYRLAWKNFYNFARCDKWAHKSYVLSAQEIIAVKFILHAFEMADNMPYMKF